MATDKTLILVTGGNSGVGFSLAAQLLVDRTKHIILGCRSVSKGEAAINELSSLNLPGTIELLPNDVSQEESITLAAEQIQQKYGRLDVLVNNAATGSLAMVDVSMSGRMLAAYRTNTFGPFLLVEAFLPLLRASLPSTTPRIINVSSAGGIVSRTLDPSTPNLGLKGIPYCASKAALNLVTASQARYYGSEGIKVFAYSPGFVVSNLGPHNNLDNGALETEIGSKPMVKIINGERDDEAGCFLRVVGTSAW